MKDYHKLLLNLRNTCELSLDKSVEAQMNLTNKLINAPKLAYATYKGQKLLLERIIDSYDSPVVRAYCKVRFTIININILHILSLCLRDRRKILDIGCGFGLFGCYFSSLHPEMEYHGYDLNSKRVRIANQSASRLHLKNAAFTVKDARQLDLNEQYDAIMMIDLLHHIDDDSKHNLLESCSRHLAPNGRLIIKDVTTHPFPKLTFTWALDVIMTRSFEMWYWDETKIYGVIGEHFNRIDTYPIADWLPYPHIVYLCENIS